MRSNKLSIAVVVFVALFMAGFVRIMSAQQLPGKDVNVDAAFGAHINKVMSLNPEIKDFRKMMPGAAYKLPDGSVDKLEKGDDHGIWGRECRKWYGHECDPSMQWRIPTSNAIAPRVDSPQTRAQTQASPFTPEKHSAKFWVLLWVGVVVGAILLLALIVYLLNLLYGPEIKAEEDEERRKLDELVDERNSLRQRLDEVVNGPKLQPAPFFVGRSLPDGFDDPTIIGERFAAYGVRLEQAEVAARQSLREVYATDHNGLRPDYSQTTVENMRHVLFSGNGEVYARGITPREMQLLREPGWTFDGTVIGPDGKVTRFEGVGTLQGCANPFRYRAEHLTGFEIEDYDFRLVHVPFDVVPFGATPGPIVRSRNVIIESESPIRIRLGDEIIELSPTATLHIEANTANFVHDPVTTGQEISHPYVRLLPVVAEENSSDETEVESDTIDAAVTES